MKAFKTGYGKPFRAQIATSSGPPRRAPAPSEPSAVAARLHVISSTCRLAGPLPGTSARSHSAYSCLGDRHAHVCCLRKGVVDVLRKA